MCFLNVIFCGGHALSLCWFVFSCNCLVDKVKCFVCLMVKILLKNTSVTCCPFLKP
jgi:hypothetical protein